ncbi:MAG: isoprenylcysteine carboxylmethyltransferase family protein [Desulfobacterium sp.]|nr:isoprenylcysteine carboxylmethyltransferase family protein [Desulfobacterium sp.]
MATRVILFIVFSLIFVRISWQPLHNPKCHGFYRFFAFEGILLLLLINAPVWFKDPFSGFQLLSWFLLLVSIFMVLHGVFLLKKMGGQENRAKHAENFAFENTVNLVEEGIYRYIRHPMYASLLFLAWGIFFKHPALYTTIPLAATTLVLYTAARTEEGENLEFFGPPYQDYIQRTRMFVPFVL